MIVVLCFSATFVIRQVSVGMVSFTCLQHLGFILGLLDGVSLASARRTSFHDTWKSKGTSSSSKLEFFSRVADFLLFADFDCLKTLIDRY